MAANFEERPAYLLRRVSTAVSQHVDRALRPFSLTHAQLGALAQLGVVDPDALSAATMGQRNGVTAQAMSAAITGLLERGLVDRAPHPTHGRILEVRITPEGEELLERAQAATGRAENRALAFLEPEQQRQLRDLLQSMMQAMDLHLYFPADEDRTE